MVFYSAEEESGMFRLDWTLSKPHEQAPTLRYANNTMLRVRRVLFFSWKILALLAHKLPILERY